MVDLTEFEDLTCDIQDCAMDVFGVKGDILYSPKSGGSFTIRAIFDNEWEHVDPDTETVISSNIPRISIKASDLKVKPTKKDKVRLKGVDYRVVNAQEDGQGGIQLLLHKA